MVLSRNQGRALRWENIRLFEGNYKLTLVKSKVHKLVVITKESTDIASGPNVRRSALICNLICAQLGNFDTNFTKQRAQCLVKVMPRELFKQPENSFS